MAITAFTLPPHIQKVEFKMAGSATAASVTAIKTAA